MAKARLLGKVDLLGLNAFGQPEGKASLWGILIGGGVSNVTTLMLARGTGKAARHADLIGFLTGAALGGAMLSTRKYKGMGYATIAAAFITSGMKWLERVLFAPKAIAAAAATGTQGMGLPMVSALNGRLGLPSIQALNGGLGLPSISREPIPAGTIPGVAGIQVHGPGFGGPPVSLLGQRAGMGGPTISGLSARYGATLLGGR